MGGGGKKKCYKVYCKCYCVLSCGRLPKCLVEVKKIVKNTKKKKKEMSGGNYWKECFELVRDVVVKVG